MLTINQIQQSEAIERLKIKNFDAQNIISSILFLEKERKELQNQLNDNLAELKKASNKIGKLISAGKNNEVTIAQTKSSLQKNQVKELKSKLVITSDKLTKYLLEIPNLPHISVPKGNSEDDNEIVFVEGNLPALDGYSLPHWKLANKYGIIDFDLGNKVTGSGFPFYKGKGAKLQRALINLCLDRAIENGYYELQPPLLVNEASGYGTGQLPDKSGQMYHVGKDNLYLIPTAEVPITNVYRNMLLNENDFPIKNVAYSSCFRREAGSYGKDVRGLNRLHQFDKVEIVQIQHPDKSYETLDSMVEYVSSLIRSLELPFRIKKLCGGDLGFTSALTYDFEVFSGAQKIWLEVSSVSNFESFQANRMKLRFKNDKGQIMLAHTLNGSALALPRIVAALLENNQTSDGIKIPKVLANYTGFDLIC